MVGGAGARGSATGRSLLRALGFGGEGVEEEGGVFGGGEVVEDVEAVVGAGEAVAVEGEDPCGAVDEDDDGFPVEDVGVDGGAVGKEGAEEDGVGGVVGVFEAGEVGEGVVAGLEGLGGASGEVEDEGAEERSGDADEEHAEEDAGDAGFKGGWWFHGGRWIGKRGGPWWGVRWSCLHDEVVQLRGR